MHDVVNLVFGSWPQQLCLGAVLEMLGKLLEQIGHRAPHPLDVFE
jgi:hypothetical protein